MAITRSVKQQYEYYVAVKSGVLDETNCLMHTAVLNENADKVVRGSVISLNAAGEFVLGLTEGSDNLYPMPCFAKKNAFDPDVMTGAVGSATGEVIASSTVGKKMSAYVATGAFEIESSEFDKDATYAINAALVCLLCRDTSCFSESFHGLLNQLRIGQICLLGESNLFLELSCWYLTTK